jgi:hypothetical protein
MECKFSQALVLEIVIISKTLFMKNIPVYLAILFLLTAAAAKAQAVSTRKHPAPAHSYSHFIKSNYICDSLFSVYTGNWLSWFVNHIRNTRDTVKSFEIPDADLKLVDSLGKIGKLPDSVEFFFAFTSDSDYRKNRINAILRSRTSFESDTSRWRDWRKQHISGLQPIGFKVRFADLDSLFSLLNDVTNPVKSLTGYFAFHSKKDMDENRISIVFRPTFKHAQKKVRNSDISCGADAVKKAPASDKEKSSINIDFTNPCPPCDGST